MKKQNKKNRILKGVVCYKIKIVPRSNGGGMFDGKKFTRLEEMIKKLPIMNKLHTVKFHDTKPTFFDEILKETTSKSKAKKQRVFNEIFDELNKMKDSNTSEPDSKKAANLLQYLDSDNGTFTDDDKDLLIKILREKSRADRILTDILASLDTEEVKKQLTPSQIAEIKSKIEGTGGVTSTLSTVTSKISNSAVALGNWFAPEIVDDDGTPIQLENKQKISFFWYPRKHIDYEKGDSRSKRGKDDATEYGDFMIMIEPEQYASVGEFFKQKYHSVEDLLATLLMGCDGAFCLRGEVKRKPYNWREYEITNKQPMKDNDKKSKNALVEA
jgi:hypothetical protein